MIRIDKLIGKLKELEVSSHYWHLQTFSAAEHTTLGMLYETLTDHIDAICESWMGLFNARVRMVDSIPLTSYEERDTLIDETRDMLRVHLTEFDGHLEIQDLLIDVLNLTNKVSYLLTHDQKDRDVEAVRFDLKGKTKANED